MCTKNVYLTAFIITIATTLIIIILLYHSSQPSLTEFQTHSLNGNSETFHKQQELVTMLQSIGWSYITLKASATL